MYVKQTSFDHNESNHRKSLLFDTVVNEKCYEHTYMVNGQNILKNVQKLMENNLENLKQSKKFIVLQYQTLMNRFQILICNQVIQVC